MLDAFNIMSILLATVLWAFAITPEQNCVETTSTPQMHGIQMGMTVKQVRKRLPFLKVSPADKYGVGDSFLYVTTDRKQMARLPKVFNIEFLFLNNRLVRYHVKYYGSDEPTAVVNFVNRVVEGFCLNGEAEISSRRYRRGAIEYSVGEDNKRTVTLLDVRAKELLDRRVAESYAK